MSHLSDALRQLQFFSEEPRRLVNTAADELDRLTAARDQDHDKSMRMIQSIRDIFADEKAAWESERAKHVQELNEVMCERDEHHDIADKLAQAIADHVLVSIGEHSSGNCPWMRALEEIKNAGLCSVFATRVAGRE